MSTAVLLLNFGEPANPEREPVIEYLRRIFLANASLDGADTETEARSRARALAERRADGLLAEYEAIGGSPLNEQAAAQAEAIDRVLTDRGFEVDAYVGMQFTEPFIEDAVRAAVEDDADRLIGLPIYPLCGPSTTVAALEEMAVAIDGIGWDGHVHEVSGWHRHPTYNRLRADNLAGFVDRAGVSLSEPGTSVVFSAHGTPQHYLDEGSRYRRYVEEYCATQAALLGLETFELGYQNHENRDIPWTEPDVETVVETLEADRVVVEPVSFMHEQSETLSELDVDLHEAATARGMDFHRVPVPHADERFPALLADLVEPFIAGIDPGYYNLRRCQCRDDPRARCLNAPTGRTAAATPLEAGQSE